MIRNYYRLVMIGMALTTGVMNFAFATDSGYYIGVTAGLSKFEGNEDLTYPFGRGYLPGDVKEDDPNDTAFTVAVGYRFTPHVGVELSYMDMGEATTSIAGHLGPLLGFANSYIDYAAESTTSAAGPALAVIGAIPFEKFELNATLGVIFAKTVGKLTMSDTRSFPPSPPTSSSSSVENEDNTVEVLVGVGAGYTFAEHFHIRLDYKLIPSVDTDAIEGKISLITLGFHYRY